MNDRTRKIILIALLAIATGILLWLMWLVFFRPAKPATNGNVNGNTNGALPGTQNGNINRIQISPDATLPINASTGNTNGAAVEGAPIVTQEIVSGATDGLTINPEGGTIQYYDRTTGQFYTIGPDGKPVLLTDAVYRGADSVTWSPNGKNAVITFPDGSKILYDFTTKRQATLPGELSEFSWSPQSDQLVSKYLDAANTDNQWLVITKPDGSQSQTVEHLGANADKVIPTWSPNNQIVGTYQKSQTDTLSNIYFLGAQGENLPSATVMGKGFIPTWSGDGRKLLYSTYSAANDDNPHLYLMNGSADKLGTGQMDLGLNTRADKCTFAPDNLSIYCAVPYYLNPGSGPHPEFSAQVPDNIYRIDLTTGFAKIIARPVDNNLQQRYNAVNMQISPDGKTMYFTDALTGTVQKISI